jgi:hypothetical protein
VSAAQIIESWEYGTAHCAPAAVSSLVGKDEHLLWAVRLRSSAAYRAYFPLSILTLVCSAFFLLVAPWGESLEEYCGPNPASRCPGVYYMLWPFVVFSFVVSLWYLWSGWKATSRPWIVTYALSTKRAFFVDEPRVKRFRYAYLRLHPPKLEPPSLLTFEGHSDAFVGLEHKMAARALYWATDGRLAVNDNQIGTAP